MVRSKIKAKTASRIVQVLDAAIVIVLFVGLKDYLNDKSSFSLINLTSIQFSGTYFILLLVMAGLWHLIFSAMGMYKFRLPEDWKRRILKVIVASSLGAAAILLVAGLAGIKEIWGVFPFLFWATILAIFLLFRTLVYSILHIVRSMGRNLLNVIVVGLNERSLAMVRQLRSTSYGFHFVGYIDYVQPTDLKNPDLPFLCPLNQFARYISQEPVDQVILALPIRSHYDDISEIISQCAVQGVETWLLTDLFDLPPNMNFRMDKIHETFFVNYFVNPRSEFSHDIKRLVDIFIAIPALLCLTPVFIFIALAILMDDGWPIFYIQERIGLNKRRFKMIKFRTMVKNAEKMQAVLEAENEASGAAFKLSNDPRVTKFGQFLRRTSLDETPQFINVLLGTMSLVGPRPLPVRDFERFYKDSHRLRFSVKPGITGMWQISGRSDVDFEEWMKLDTFYVNNWSILLDLNILIRTAIAVLSMKGAY